MHKANSSDDLSYARPRLEIAIETVWLLALALVPVVFNGPDVVVVFLNVLKRVMAPNLVIRGFNSLSGCLRGRE